MSNKNKALQDPELRRRLDDICGSLDAIERVLRIAVEHIGSERFSRLRSVKLPLGASVESGGFHNTLNAILSEGGDQ